MLKGAVMSGSGGTFSRVLTKIRFASECDQHPWKQGIHSPPGPEHLVRKVSVKRATTKKSWIIVRFFKYFCLFQIAGSRQRTQQAIGQGYPAKHPERSLERRNCASPLLSDLCKCPLLAQGWRTQTTPFEFHWYNETPHLNFRCSNLFSCSSSFMCRQH